MCIRFLPLAGSGKCPPDEAERAELGRHRCSLHLFEYEQLQFRVFIRMLYVLNGSFCQVVLLPTYCSGSAEQVVG